MTRAGWCYYTTIGEQWPSCACRVCSDAIVTTLRAARKSFKRTRVIDRTWVALGLAERSDLRLFSERSRQVEDYRRGLRTWVSVMDPDDGSACATVFNLVQLRDAVGDAMREMVRRQTNDIRAAWSEWCRVIDAHDATIGGD